MLMRVLGAAGVAALLGGCAGEPPSVPPPVRDGSLPGAAAAAAATKSAPVQAPVQAPAATGIDRFVPQPESASGRAGIPRPRPAEAPPARREEGGAGAAVTPRAEATAAPKETPKGKPMAATPKETPKGKPMAAAPKETPKGEPTAATRRTGAGTAAARGASLAAPGLPGEDTRREGNAAVAALLESAREAEKARQYGRAGAALERALKVEPRNPWLWHRLATIRYRQGRHPEAEALARRSMSLARGDVKLESRNWRVIAAARHGQGDEEGARDALGRANAP